MSHPLSVEDSTDVNYSPTLRQLLETLGEDANDYDYLVVALIAIMAEAGFHAGETQSNDTEQRSMARTPRIPSNWKSKATGTYSITFQPHVTTKLECKLVAIPVEGSLIVNLFSMSDCQNMYSIAIPTEPYINSGGSKACLTNLRKFSFRFKDSVLTPVHSEYLQKLGVPSPCLTGLPTELQFKILECLRICDIARVMQCCRKFYDLVQASEKFKDKLSGARIYESCKRKIPVSYRLY